MSDLQRVTTALRRELGTVCDQRPAVRRAALFAQLRIAGQVSTTGGRTSIEAEVNEPDLASRMCHELIESYGRTAVEAHVLTANLRRPRHFVRVTVNDTELARTVSLIDRSGWPALQLPPALLGEGTAVAAGVWRGALLARGRLTRPAGRTRIQVTCPGPAVVSTLLGAARALGVLAAGQQTRTEHRVAVRDPRSVNTLLRASGAPHAADVLWRRAQRAPSAPPALNPGLDSVNTRRAVEAADRTTAHVRWALDILGPDAPPRLRAAGLLRVQHPTLSLPELGALADPPLSKHAIAGRLRRLIACADTVTDQHRPRRTP